MKHIIVLFSLLIISLSADGAVDGVDSLALAPEQQMVDVMEVVNTVDTILPDSLWDIANTAYINADYNRAVDLYTSIADIGLVSDKLFFNLGNAYYKSDDMAKAILYYQKALLISPNDADILYNLGVAQSQIKDQIEEIPEFFLRRWSRSIARLLNCTGWTILSLVALVVLLSSILLFVLSSSVALRKCGFGVGLFAALLCCITTLYALGERREILDHNQAVVMSQSISIKSSPDRSATDLFMLHSGTTVKILREVDNWFEIVIADGKKGWIESNRVEQI